MHELTLLPIIFVISLVLTMVGLGGGLFYSPLFLLLGFAPPVAAATSLFLNGVAAMSAAITYWRRKMVDMRTGLALLVASTLAAPAGASLSPLVPARAYTLLLAGIMLAAALRMLRGKKAAVPGRSGPGRRGSSLVIGILAGLAIGLMAGLLGIGGGIFIVPLLGTLAGMEVKQAAATSVFVVTFSSFSGFLAHVGLHAMNWAFVLPAALTCFLGGQLGSRLMITRIPPRTIKRIFAVILVLFALKLLQRAIPVI